MKIRLRLKVYPILLLVALSIMTISMAKATVTGTWDVCTSSNFTVLNGDSPVSPLENYADFSLSTVNSFSGLNFTFTINHFEKSPLASWSFSNELNFYYTIKLTGFTGESVYAQGQFREFTTWFGIADNLYRETHKSFNPSNHSIDSVGVWWTGANEFDFHLNRYVSNLTYTYEDSTGDNFQGVLYHDNRTQPLPDDWFNSVAVTLYVGWSGQGSFDIDFACSFYQNTDHSTARQAVGFSEIPPSGVIGFLIGIKDMFISLGVFFSQLVYGLIPLMPIIFFCYLADAVITSISQMSFTPIGNAFMFIWEQAVYYFELLMMTLDSILPF